MSTLQDELLNLLEIQSLEMKIKSHLDIIDEEKSRLSRVEQFRNSKSTRLNELNLEISKLNEFISNNEKEIFSLESKLKKTESHLSMVANDTELKALEKELASLKPKLDELQEHGLAQLERLEDFEIEIEEIKEYLVGSLDTLNDIKLDIEEVSNKENLKIDALNKRISLIREGLSSDTLKNFDHLNKKYKYNKPVTFLLGNNCRECRFQVDQGGIQEIERFTSLYFCNGCGRIITLSNT